ncbi:hypothetical protein [Umezawaea sp. Da 62-37]|uniref:hypothetical protein n=1 Tax=Umezawaea sp. Da 62-37 TaxID=3075927 RepID=UPI0028F70BFE|nr:hypothetical protein [Umezawaea sp. Da 62-37]WNV89546.1 hypothetical protein RM788_14955 [Umezawaea sp. Da 62-37]
MAFQAVHFPREYRPVVGAARAVVAFAWIEVVGWAVCATGAWGLVRSWEAKAASPEPALAVLIVGGVVLLAAAFATLACSVFWRGRARWNAKLAVGAVWTKRRTAPWWMPDVLNASDPVRRSAAPADRPRNPVFALWSLGSCTKLLVFLALAHFGNDLSGIGYFRFLALAITTESALAVLTSAMATLGVRAITRGQTDPAMFPEAVQPVQA